MTKKPFNIWDKNSLKIHLMNLQSLLVYLESIPCATPCRACNHFDLGTCKKWEITIPDDIKEVGCEEFNFNSQSAPF